MRCTLNIEVAVERFAAFAELAWMERRPELAALCEAARAAGGRLTPDGVRAVLPGVSEPGAKNVIGWCRALRLFDEGGALTALGDDVAKTGEAPVPEQGVFDFWTVRHPLLGSRALHVERITATQDGRFDAMTAITQTPELGVVYRSCVDPRDRFMVRVICPGGSVVGMVRPTVARCRVAWTLDFTAGTERFTLTGTIDGDGAPRPIRHEAESGGDDLEAVLASWARGPLAVFGRWDSQGRRLAVPFADLAVDAQDRFQKALSLDHAEVPGRGTWKNVQIDGVPIGPATAEDAARWSMARLDRRLAEGFRYRTHDDVAALFASITRATPLEAHAPALPASKALLDRHAATPAILWSLAAPADLFPTQIEVLR